MNNTRQSSNNVNPTGRVLHACSSTTDNTNNNNNNNKCPGYDIKLHPVVEFRRGIVRLPFATATSRSPLSKVYYLQALPETIKCQVDVWQGLVNLMGGGDSLALDGSPSSDGVTIKTLLFGEAYTM